MRPTRRIGILGVGLALLIGASSVQAEINKSIRDTSKKPLKVAIEKFDKKTGLWLLPKQFSFYGERFGIPFFVGGDKPVNVSVKPKPVYSWYEIATEFSDKDKGDDFEGIGFRAILHGDPRWKTVGEPVGLMLFVHDHTVYGIPFYAVDEVEQTLATWGTSDYAKSIKRKETAPPYGKPKTVVTKPNTIKRNIHSVSVGDNVTKGDK